MRRLLLALVVPLLLVGGGTALAASNAPGHARPGRGAEPSLVAVGNVPVPALAHPASSPVPVVVTPTPTATPTPTPTTASSTQASATPAPARTSTPAAKPRPTPPPVVVVTPKPQPTPPPIVDSGTLPPIQVTFSNGTSWSGDSYSNSWSCQAQTNCLPDLTFSVASWGNYDLTVTYTEEYHNWSGPIEFFPSTSGSLGGYGPSTGESGIGMTGGGNNNYIALTITVSWGPAPS